MLAENTVFRAVAGGKSSVGRTPGEALDGLLAQLDPDAPISLFVIAKDRGDAFFTQAQFDRLTNLLNRQNDGETLTESERRELTKLVEAEVRATVARTSSLAA